MGLAAPEACGVLTPRARIDPASPAYEGIFLTTGPPGVCPRSTFSRRSCHAARAALKPGLTAQLPGDCRGGAAGARSGFGEALPASHAGGSAQARSCWRRLLSPLRARCPRAHPPPRPPPFQVPQQPGHGCRCGSLASTTWTPHIPVAFRKPTVGPYPGPGLPGPWVRGTYRPQPPAHV